MLLGSTGKIEGKTIKSTIVINRHTIVTHKLNVSNNCRKLKVPMSTDVLKSNVSFPRKSQFIEKKFVYFLNYISFKKKRQEIKR